MIIDNFPGSERGINLSDAVYTEKFPQCHGYLNTAILPHSTLQDRNNHSRHRHRSPVQSMHKLYLCILFIGSVTRV